MQRFKIEDTFGCSLECHTKSDGSNTDLSREEWISRHEASLIRSGFQEDTAKMISERFYALYLRRSAPIELCVQNPDGSFTKL